MTMGFLTPFHGLCMALADSVPGVSGGTVAFILGFYDRFINALHDLFDWDKAARKTALVYLLKLGIGWVAGMGLMALGFGVIAGVALSIKAIRGALQKHRSAMIWFILGLMLGSLYAIAMGPASLQTPQPPLSAASFRPLAFLLGVGLLVGLELLRRRMERGVTAA